MNWYRWVQHPFIPYIVHFRRNVWVKTEHLPFEYSQAASHLSSFKWSTNILVYGPQRAAGAVAAILATSTWSLRIKTEGIEHFALQNCVCYTNPQETSPGQQDVVSVLLARKRASKPASKRVTIRRAGKGSMLKLQRNCETRNWSGIYWQPNETKFCLEKLRYVFRL